MTAATEPATEQPRMPGSPGFAVPQNDAVPPKSL